jgi:hypothetical protein
MGYEYKVVAVQVWHENRIEPNLESLIEEYAKGGWRLAHTIAKDGWTSGFIFERHQ